MKTSSKEHSEETDFLPFFVIIIMIQFKKGFIMCLFEPSNIRKIFGSEDAADEDIQRLKKFFFKTSDYKAIKSDSPLVIVTGFKGVGKSALLKIAYEEDKDENKPALWIRPDDVIEMMDELASTNLDFSKIVLLWKRGIAKLVASRIASDWLFVYNDEQNAAINWAQNTGYRNRDFVQKIISILKPSIINLPLNLEEQTPLTGEHHIIERLLNDKQIYLYFDDLDAGWEAKKEQQLKLSALLLALRNMTSDIPGLKVRLAFRTDVYTLLRESDESTDKIENYVINCSWKNHDIIILLAKRILTFFDENINDKELEEYSLSKLNEVLGKIMCKKFTKTKAWKNKYTNKVIASLIRSRPRDMIKLCSLAAKTAYERDPETKFIDDIDFENILDEYSRNRVQDIVNEFKNELPNIEDLLYRMAPTTKEIKNKTKNVFVYSTNELLKKIKNIRQNIKLELSYKSYTEDIDIAHFLYKIGFITARREIKDVNNKIIKIDRKYYDEKKQLLKSGAIGDGGYSWEIHPAYRSAISTHLNNNWMQTVDID